MNKTTILIILALVVAVGGGYWFINKDEPIQNNKTELEDVTSNGFGNGYKAIVYKDPNCGCCVGYADELEKLGFEVEVVATEDMASIKDEYKIPADKQSCHTIAVAGYVVEGHVPMEAVEQLLKDKPEIDGIGLARMPAGTPGMPGTKSAPYEVYQIKDGVFSSFMTI